MNILFLTSRADLGGGPEHLYQLIANRPQHTNVFIACPKDEPYWSRYLLSVGQSNLHEIPHRSFRFGALLAMVKVVRHSSIEVIHSHGKGAGIYSRLLSFITGIPCAHTFHGLHVGSYGKLRELAYLQIERILGWRTSQAICVSHGEMELIAKAGFISKTKLQVIENGVVVPVKIRDRAQVPKLNMVAVNRYDYQKNPELLVDIARILKDKISFKLKIIGTGEKLEAIKKLVKKFDLSHHVEICGGVNNPRKYFSEAEIFLSTSRWEGMPLAVLEAMSEGVCPVVTDVVGNRDVVNNDQHGILFKTAEEAADSIVKISNDSSYIAYGVAAREFVRERHSVEKMAAETYSALSQCFSAKTSGSTVGNVVD